MAKLSRFTVLAALVLVMAACGGDASDPDANGSLPSPAPGSSSTTTSLDLESPDEPAPDPSVPTTAIASDDATVSTPSSGAGESETTTTLSIPKPSFPLGTIPAGTENVVAMATADLGDRLDVPSDEILVVGAGFVSVPADNPCQPTVLDRRDEEVGSVPAIEVVLRHGGVDYRYVEEDGQLHACETIAGN